MPTFHFPVTFHLGGMQVSLHGLMETLGIFVAFRYYLFLKKKQGDTIQPYNRLWILIAATLGAVAGSHLVGALENVPAWQASHNKISFFRANKTMLGGLLGGLFSVELTKKIIGERQNSGDLFVYPLILALMIGRVGCFSAGIYEQTYGLPTTLPWGMNLGDGIPRHPVALYEIVFLLLLWAGLKAANRRWPLANGAEFKLLLMAYFLFRFLLDFIKPGWHYFLGLGTIQIGALAGLVYYGRYILRPRLLLASVRPHNVENRHMQR